MLREPALLHGLFCNVLRTLEHNPSNLGCVGARSMQHYGKSIYFLKRRITDPSVVFDDAIYWTIITLIVYDLDRHNWESFAVNSGGLRRLISLRGGATAVRASCERSYRFYTWVEKCYEKRDSIFHSNPSTSWKVPIPLTSTPKYFQVLSEKLRTCSQNFPVGFGKMAVENMFEPDTIYVIERFVRWYNAHASMSSENRTGRYTADVRASLLAELHGLLRQNVLTGRARVISLAMFALALAIDHIYLDARYGGVFSGDMIDFSYVSKDMLSEDCVIWLALILAPMHIDFFMQSNDRWNLLHLVVVHQKRSAQWSDVRTRLQTFYAPEHLLTQWECCWRIATQKLPEEG